MTSIVVTYNEISLSGHAGYASSGQDIVCSAISALANSIVNGLGQLTESVISLRYAEAEINIEIKSIDEKGRLLVDAFLLGVKQVASVYPDNVRVSDER